MEGESKIGSPEEVEKQRKEENLKQIGQKIALEDIKRGNLADYQQEMQEFTKFLKDKYFRS